MPTRNPWKLEQLTSPYPLPRDMDPSDAPTETWSPIASFETEQEALAAHHDAMRSIALVPLRVVYAG